MVMDYIKCYTTIIPVRVACCQFDCFWVTNYLLRTVANDCCVCVDVGLTFLSIYPRVVVKTSPKSPIRSLATGSPSVADFHHNSSLALSGVDNSCLGDNF